MFIFTRIRWESIKMFSTDFMSIDGYFTFAWQFLLIRLSSFNLYLKRKKQLFESTDNKYYHSSENGIPIIRMMDIATILVTKWPVKQKHMRWLIFTNYQLLRQKISTERILAV